MARCFPTPRSAAEPLRGQDGFTVVELLAAIAVLAVCALAAGAVLASSTRYESASEVRQVLAHRAQQEIERLAALPYGGLGHDAAPASGAASGPLSYYDPRTRTYRWDRTAAGASSAEPLVVLDSAAVTRFGSVPVGPTGFGDGRIAGELYDLVTWATVTDCNHQFSGQESGNNGCVTTQPYKRITVAALATAGGPAVAPVYVSTIVADPHAVPAGRSARSNPLAGPTITCTDPATGAQRDCTSGVGSTNVNDWYLSDSPASGAYAAPSGSHPAHTTVACPAGQASGCPMPDLLASGAPPSASPTPPLYDFSTDLSSPGLYPGGRLLRRDSADCSAAPTASNATSAMWATAPLSASTALTGSGGMSLYTQTAGGVPASVTLCLGLYDVASLGGLATGAPSPLGVLAYTYAAWPTTPTRVSFSFDFLSSGTVTVPAGDRIGARLWVAPTSAADVAVLYDHPSYPTVLQLNSR